ncbi:S-layer homology domain-containing protein [Paenibacillus brevis]|uniref:S-layer homology domain-containing protein n=1 Tax=Paenibacillus brevis TaxID=2841508 RepID=A0ABS6FLX1_9BACL|nr:S-layer homology domain-containing protein [Paenibacillus brevis]MBU5671202.1 S-layer homology domain-containing protein [Paenibacillus brevis]
MKRCKTLIAGLLSLLLLCGILPVYPAAASSGSGAADIPAGKVLIKNKWKNNYLYEASNGTVRYGMTNPQDESAHWTVVTENGKSVIRNSKTGNYITAARTPERNQPLMTSSQADTDAEKWFIDLSNRSGYLIIRSATVPSGNLVIHEEDQLGFAEVSADINITFESPQWAFISLDESPVRIESLMRPGHVIYEEEGRVKHGVIAAGDPQSHWFLEDDGNGQLQIRNQATGHVILQNETTYEGIAAGEPDADNRALSLWQMADAATPEYVVFQNVGLPGNWMNPQFEDDNVRSNDWAGGADGVNALWKVEPYLEELPSVRIGAYTDEATATDYLYEDQGQVKHGGIGSSGSDPDYLWIIEDYDFSKRIRNAGTGHYLKLEGDSLLAESLLAASTAYEWSFTDSDAYDDYKTIGSTASQGRYIAIGTSGGQVRAGTDAESLEAQWELIDPSLPAGEGERYIRIQNAWQPFYLYENMDSTLKYGNLRKEDKRDQWLVIKHQGRKLLQNRETGNYMNIADMPDGHIQVTALSDPEQAPQAYIWSGKNLGGNTYLLSNATDKVPGEPFTKFLSLQNLTKYAEYSVINPNWGSPQWRFLPVTEQASPYFRFQLKDFPGLYLRDAENENSVTDATYGPIDDAYSIWYLQQPAGSSAYMLKNQGSGRFLSIQNLADQQVESEDEPMLPVETRSEVYEVWGSIKWVIDPKADNGNVTLKSGWTGHYLYAVTDENGQALLKVSRAEGASNRPEAQWMAESVTLPEQPIPNTPVRIKSAVENSYLYENPGGVVMYGSLADNNGYSHWVITEEGGVQQIRNRATGHDLTLNEDYMFLESVLDHPADQGRSDWLVERSDDGKNVTIRSASSSYNDEYIHLENHLGYAERGLLPTSYGTVQWSLEAAPQDFITPPMAEERNLNTSTPIQNDTNEIYISLKTKPDKVLADQAGRLVYADAGDTAAAKSWLMQDFNGRHLLKNTTTGRYLTLSGQLQPALASQAGSLGTQWTVETRGGFYTLENASASGYLSAGTSVAGPSYSNSEADYDEVLWSFTKLSSDVTYPADEAFRGGEVIRFAVHAAEAQPYDAVIRYRNLSGAEQHLQLQVNGLDAGELLVSGETSGWRTAEVRLSLRAGMNSVSLEGEGDALVKSGVASLMVKNSVNKDYRGATTPYITYEAEHGKSNAELIGPSRKYRSMASEASGRQAVKLSDIGDYVEFEAAEQANSLVLRYSIPDSADGSGLEETLSLYVNGQFKQRLELTSKYAWEYGSYPWSNDPRQGSGHRFYDEIHARIGEVPAGSVIRLQKDNGDNAAYYVIDLVDLEQVESAYDMPDGFLSVTEFGAVPNDGIDDTDAFRAALAEAMLSGKGIWFPEGSFDFGDDLLGLDSAVIRGAGMWHTRLNGAKFYGHGGRIEVYDLLIDGGINERDDEAFTNAFHGAYGQGSILQHVWIEHTKAGLWLTQPIGERARTNGLYMMGLRIRNLMADGINFAVGTSNSMMEHSDIRYPGDDGIAMWSFTDAKLKDVNGDERTPSVNNTARFNTVSLPWLADNIVVFGGKDNKIQDNVVMDTVTNGAGIAVSTRFSAEPFEGTTIVERNTMLRAGSYDTGYSVSLGALWLYAGESNMNGNIIVRNNVAKDSTYAGLILHGDYAMNQVHLQNLVIDGTGTNGIDVTANLKGSATVDNVIVRGDRVSMISNPAEAFSFLEQNKGFASVKKPVVDPGTPGEGGGNGNANNSGTSQNGSSQGEGSTDTNDSKLTQGLATGSSMVEISVGDNGVAAFSLKLLSEEASRHPDASILLSDPLTKGSFTFPLKLVEQVLLQAGITDGSQARIEFGILPVQDTVQSILNEKAAGLGMGQSIPAVKFTVSVVQGEIVKELSRLPVRVERTLALEGPWNPDRAVALRFDTVTGELRYVPALFRQNSDGSFTAVLKTAENGIFTVADHPKSFIDLAGHWARKDIEKLASRMIVNGISEERFAADRPVTRSEFAAMLLRALGVHQDAEEGDSLAPVFTDVGRDDWFHDPVMQAAKLGLLQGYTDGSYRPQAAITREEMGVIAYRAMTLLSESGEQKTDASLEAFSDAGQVHGWSQEAIRSMLGAGMMQGRSNGTFAPAEQSSRAEAAVLVARLLVWGQLMNP